MEVNSEEREKYEVQTHYSSTEHWHQALQNAAAVLEDQVEAAALPVAPGCLLVCGTTSVQLKHSSVGLASLSG